MKRARAREDAPAAALSETARSAVERWSDDDRATLERALRALPDDLHRELLQRAIAAGRGPEESLAFGRVLETLSTADALAACSFRGADPELRLRAAGDPLFAFEENGRPTARSGLPIPMRKHPGAPPKENLPTATLDARQAFPADEPSSPPRAGNRPRSRTLGDDAGLGKRARVELKELGESEEASYSRSRSEAGFATDVFNAALEPFGVVLQERTVDGPALKLEQALDRAAELLRRGMPVPIALGREVGEIQRYALILQVQASGRSRAFQLLDPVLQELVWAHESDLLRRVELPFESKAYRRITAVSLPRASK